MIWESSSGGRVNSDELIFVIVKEYFCRNVTSLYRVRIGGMPTYVQ